MAVERVIVERHLGVEALEIAVGGDDQRVDLEHLHVLRDEGGIELLDQRLRLLGEVARQVQRLGDATAVVAHDSGRGIDGEGDDLLGRLVRDVLDVHAAFGRDDEGDARGRAIDEHRQVEFLGDVGAFLDVEAVDLLAGRAGLDGHQRRAEHLLDVGDDLVDRLGEAHAALVAGRGFLELALAAATGVDLRLDDPERTAERLGGGFRVLGVENRDAARDGRAELLQDRFGLVFMNVHSKFPFSRTRRAPLRFPMRNRRRPWAPAAFVT